MVDVHSDQHAGDHDERDQQDAEDEADVQGLVRARDPIYGAVGWHHWGTRTRELFYIGATCPGFVIWFCCIVHIYNCCLVLQQCSFHLSVCRHNKT